ncbi:E3 ubiquitin-protein ligase RNF180 isoform X2 [Antennarius striatus]|uniref:E3 ubiquitin-protein ligase RNF180 isoform X2 n=1 Tax=Antennarius striatus TaxID=241820 RepID=UPI0035B426AD
MLRCRRCRKGIAQSAFLSVEAEATDRRSPDACNIWHINVDTLPEWIVTAVEQAQWTVGKLNCENCAARLGGFNFIHHSECPCGRDVTIHLNKSRVDWDHKHCVPIVQPRKKKPGIEQGGLLTNGCHTEQRAHFEQAELDSLHLDGAAVMSSSSPADASGDGENVQSLCFSPLSCSSHRRQSCLEDYTPIRSSCFSLSSTVDKFAVKVSRAETNESVASAAFCPPSQVSDNDVDVPFNAVACHSLVSGRTYPPMFPITVRTREDAGSSPENIARGEEVSDSLLSLREGSISDSFTEQDEDEQPQVFMASLAPNSLSKREKNRLKGFRRKQRKKERWLHSRQKQTESVTVSLDDSREGLTCAICLDIYFSPHSCHPCGHVFCEPCLRTLAKNRHTNTPCPLCRALISDTSLHKELNRTTKDFSNVYSARKLNFMRSYCARWPLPSCQKCFRTFWERRREGMAQRRWHFAMEDLTLNAWDFTNFRTWLFDIFLVIICIHSVNWVLAFLFILFVMFYFFC